MNNQRNTKGIVRPSLVIGVGGTGVSVLSWIKKDILETYGDYDQLPLRLLLIDVVEPQVRVGRAGVNPTEVGADFFETSYDDLDLDKEFVQIATAVTPVSIEQVKAGVANKDPQFAHFSRWYCHDKFPPQLETNLASGAGRLRQLGRMAAVYGIHAQGKNDPLYVAINNKVSEILKDNRQIDIHLVGSFAGGTGSGIFQDVIWLVRKIVKEVNPNASIFVSGFFAMPRALMQMADKNMSAKAFNAWRELNRMMTINQSEGNDFMLRWGSDGSRMFNVRDGIIDQVYLFAKPVDNIYRAPNEGLFPMMGEAVSFFIDAASGTPYIEQIRNNLLYQRNTAEYRGRPVYSVCYVKAWKLPAFHNKQLVSHELANTYLEQMLQINRQPVPTNTSKNAQRGKNDLTAEQVIEEISLAQVDGIDEVPKIFLSDLSSYNVGNTLFIQSQDNWRRTPADREEAFLQQFINENLYNMFLDLPDDDTTAGLRFKIHQIGGFEVPGLLDTNDGNQLKHFAQATYGILYGDGVSQGEYRRRYGDFVGQLDKGDLYDVLIAVCEYQLEVFKKRLSGWSNQTLNNNRGVGLALLASALEHLRFGIEKNLTLLQAVKQRLPNINNLRADAQNKYTEFMNYKPGVFGALVGGGYHKEAKIWHESEQVHLYYMSNHRVLDRMIELQQEMVSYVKSFVIVNVNAMIAKLVETDPIQSIQESVFYQVIKSLKAEQRRAAADAQAEGVIDILPVDENMIQTNRQQTVRVLSENSAWSVSPDDFRIHFNIQLEGENEDETRNLSISSQRGEQANSQVRQFTNYLVNDLVQSAIAPIDMNAIDVLLPRLQDELFGVSQINRLMFVESRLGVPPNTQRTFYLRCNTNQDQAMIDRIKRIMQSVNLPVRPGTPIDLVDSSNRQKVVAFHAYELLPPEAFDEWETCRNDYWERLVGNHVTGVLADPTSVRCDYLFAGEKQATTLEYTFCTDNIYSKIRTPGEQLILTNRIVHLLENRDLFLEALQLWALEYIILQPGSQPELWLNIPDSTQQGYFVLGRHESDSFLLKSITRYLYRGEDMNQRLIERQALSNLLQDQLKTHWLNQNNIRNLMQRYEYEREMAWHLAQMTQKYQRTNMGFGSLTRDNLDQAVSELRQKYQVMSIRNPEYHHETLAERLLIDEIASANDETTIQLLRVVIPLLYDELYKKVDQIRISNNWR